MEPREFATIAAEMQSRWWSFPIPASALEQYMADLADLDGEQVRAAVAAIGTGDAQRPPTSGQIRRRVVEMQLDLPAWDEVRVSLARWLAGSAARRAAVWTCPDEICDGSSWTVEDRIAKACACRTAFVEARQGYAELHPVVAEFVRGQHVHAEEIRKMFEGHVKLAEDIRYRWRDFSARAVESGTLAGIAGAAVLPRLDAARDEAEALGQLGRMSNLNGGRMVDLIERAS